MESPFWPRRTGKKSPLILRIVSIVRLLIGHPQAVDYRRSDRPLRPRKDSTKKPWPSRPVTPDESSNEIRSGRAHRTRVAGLPGEPRVTVTISLTSSVEYRDHRGHGRYRRASSASGSRHWMPGRDMGRSLIPHSIPFQTIAWTLDNNREWSLPASTTTVTETTGSRGQAWITASMMRHKTLHAPNRTGNKSCSTLEETTVLCRVNRHYEIFDSPAPLLND